MQTEVYKDIITIPELIGKYQISNLGNIKYKLTGKLRKISISTNGYKSITFRIGKKIKHFRIHRLLAQHFIPNPDNKGDVNHINGIKTDNRLENLEWMTRSENIKHACWDLGYKIKKIKQMDLKGNILKIYTSLIEASKDNNINFGNISQVCSGKRKTAGGFKWQYA